MQCAMRKTNYLRVFLVLFILFEKRRNKRLNVISIYLLDFDILKGKTNLMGDIRNEKVN